MQPSAAQLRTYSRILLGTLFAVLLAGAFFYDRTDWPRPALLAGEATYLMQAESLAYDHDLAYSRKDFNRALVARHGEPPDLELASGSGGRAITYDRPFPYALFLAPFVRLSPAKGFVFANLVLLALASLFAVAALEAVLEAAAPLWVALFVFASVTWSYVWLATGDLFLFTVVVVALALVAMARGGEGRLTGRRRRHPPPSRMCWIAGALLAVPLATEPLYGLLIVAAIFALPKGGTAPTRSALLLGGILSLFVQVMAQWWWSGGLHFYATTRFRFTRETGFPLIDFTAAEWSDSVQRFQALYWDGAPRFSWGVDPLLWLWDFFYLAVGQHIGLLPYFLPLLVLLAGGSLRGFRRPIAIAAGVWLVALVVLRPFNLHGGEGTLGNRLFLPVYGALWLLLDRPPRKAWAPVIAAVAGLFLWNLWTAPWSYPVAASGGYRYVTPVAERLLPFETSQRWIPDNQLADHMGLRIRLLNEGAWAETRRELLKVDADRRVRMVVASPVKLPSLTLELGSDAPSGIVVRGARQEDRVLLSDGGISFRLRPRGFSARHHAMWWTPDRQWLYVLDLRLPGGTAGDSLAFQLFSEVLFEGGDAP